MRKRSSMPSDINQLAKPVVGQLTGQGPPNEEESTPEKNPAAVALGRLGGLKGGPARAAKLSAKRRKEIARKAAQARWSKESKPSRREQ